MERQKLISLVTAAQKGKSEALNGLFEAYYNDVYYFALKTVKDSEIACDITQDTFVEIINTIADLKEPAAFVTWMKQITYHQCTRYFKKKKEVLVDEDEEGNTIFDTLADEREDSIPSEVYEKEDFRNTILGIINELTEEQRSAVMLYYFDELSVGQIAQIQNVSEGTVKSRLNYARKAIKKSVESYEKKHNIKLHSFAFLPLFMLFFGKEFMPAEKVTTTRAVIRKAARAGAAAAKGAAVGAAKMAAMPVATKIIAGVVAVALVAGVGIAAVRLAEKEPAGEENASVDSGVTNAQEETSGCNGRQNGVITCDEDNDFHCDVTGQPICDEDHIGVHVDTMEKNNQCDACGAKVVSMPMVYMADDMLCIVPGYVSGENQEYAYFDTVDAMYEVYNLDTGELICSRHRSEFDHDMEEQHYASVYSVGMQAHYASIKVPISDITGETTCNIGVRAKSLDENYADTGLSAVRYVAVSELKPLNVTIDDAGVMHIENYNPDYQYRIYVGENPETAYEVYIEVGQETNLLEAARFGGMVSPPIDGSYTLHVYEFSFSVEEIYACTAVDIPVINIYRNYHGNHEAVVFYVSADEYVAQRDPGEEPVD